MKTLEQLVKQTPVYLNDWEKSGKFGMVCDFENIYMTKEEYESTECTWGNEDRWMARKHQVVEALQKYKPMYILFASYGCANYSGDAWVLFVQDGKLYEVHGSHCSCYGLENQWEPEEVSLIELEHRLLNGSFGEDNFSDNNFKEEVCEFLGVELKYNSKRYYDYN